MAKRKQQLFGWGLLGEQVIKVVSDEILGTMACLEHYQGGARGTPIERLFLTALQYQLRFIPQEWFQEIVCVWEKCPLEMAQAESKSHFHLLLERQAQLPDWRVDFLIHAYADWSRADIFNIPVKEEGWQRLIVECDGHDFHERTKEQAARDRARDRWAQCNGYEIFRFTGSELWRNPLGCADQVIQWANRGV